MHTWLLNLAARAELARLWVGQRGGLDAGFGGAARLPGGRLAGAAAPAQAVRLVAVAVELAGRPLLLALGAHLQP